MNGFNAIKYVGGLREAGVPEKQAEVHLRILHDVIESNLATKRDIEELKTKLKRDIEELKTELKRDIEELRTELKRDIQEVRRDMKELEQRMTIKLGGLIVVTIGIIVALSNINII
ncbi:MAG: hypothetical protein OXF23_02210 [Candidatus Dadabacteria bacterium]|nr:hypothetical protein [Candidatus Dadabacteria bacterium]